jgi:two-component system, chemotaxis family, CheB/CheR fusion protein
VPPLAAGDPDAALRLQAFEVADVPQLVLDGDRRLVLVNERARALLQLSPADLGRPIQDLQVSYRPFDLRSRLDQAEDERRVVIEREVRWGDAGVFDVHVTPLLSATGIVHGLSVAFADVRHFLKVQDDLRTSQRELETAYEELQSTVEELETTNEELQSTNEELETTNEELQSTNEELETMNEELQSTNEELETMNDELRLRSDELNEVNVFFSSVLRSIASCIVVVDADLHVHVWNAQAEDLWGLRADEVIGDHLLSLDIGLPLHDLREPLRRCLSGESVRELLTLTATNRRGKAVECTVEMLPLALGADPQGVVVLIDAREPG